MDEIALRAENLGKMYRIGVADAQPRTAWQAVWRQIASPFAYLRRMQRPPTEAETLWALRDVSFEVKRGEALGVVGRNGAGKSTLLKILSRVTDPTSGSAMIHGRVGSLLEAGTGFHPELAGRENIYLSGAILGMHRAEIDRKFDDIVAFAEIERFLDTPVKRYSSGMYVRLAFAVAARLEPEILLVDEVLAVGDTMFQYKCLGRIRELVNGGATVMFVSHNLDSMQALCQRVLWLDQGRVQADGPAAEVIEAYLNHQEQQTVGRRKDSTLSAPGPMKITQVVLRDGAGRKVTEFRSDEEIIVELTYAVDGIIQSPHFSVGVSDSRAGLLFLATMLVDGQTPHQLSGSGTVSCRFSGISLMPKAYQVWGSVRDERGLSDIVGWQQMAAFRVVTPPQELMEGDRPVSISHLKNDAPIYVPHEWIIG